MMENAVAKVAKVGGMRRQAVEDVHLQGHTILSETRAVVDKVCDNQRRADEVRLEGYRRRATAAADSASMMRQAHADYKAYLRPIEERQKPGRWMEACNSILANSGFKVKAVSMF